MANFLAMPPVAVHSVPTTQRVTRRPQHTFLLRHRPWVIQPFFLAPVLPGETLKNLLWQSRVVSDPVKNPLIGWWLEYYVFYVKHRDLAGREDFTAMMLDPAYDLSSYNEAAHLDYYHFGGSINWTKLCLQRVVEEYFRDENEAWDDHVLASVTTNNMPIASINQQTWLDSVVNDDAYTAEDVDVDLDADNDIMASEVEAAMRQWHWQRHQQLTDMSYEDFLRTYGIRSPETDPHRPELVRYAREWSYPTNHIDPTDGTPSSALSWAVAERADKDRFFSEPGFLIGVTVCRPKVYLQNQKGMCAGLLNDAFSWLPAILNADPAVAIKKVTAGANGPLAANTDDYRVDIRDLFLYGDQFINHALTETNANIISLPTATLQKRFAASADADELFVSASPANQIRQDGVVSLTILGRQTDMTPRTNR